MSIPWAIDITGLRKNYRGNPEPALDGIDLRVPQGEIFGLLGPNGAGKTTSINIICGTLKATEGAVKITGLDIRKDQEKIKHLIGVVPQEIALYNSLSARENLNFIGSMYGLKGKTLTARVNHCLETFGLENFANRQIRTYSGGMKRRINLIAGILHNPQILFLDEPTVGVDVQSRNVIIEYLKTINAQGTSIIYTSHYMEEAELLCTSLAIIDQGRIIIQGKPQELINSQPAYHNLESIFLHLTGKKLRDY